MGRSVWVILECSDNPRSLIGCVLSGIGEVEWAFRTTFIATETEVAASNVDLVFDGLDTFAEVELVSRGCLALCAFC